MWAGVTGMLSCSTMPSGTNNVPSGVLQRSSSGCFGFFYIMQASLVSLDTQPNRVSFTRWPNVLAVISLMTPQWKLLLENGFQIDRGSHVNIWLPESSPSQHLRDNEWRKFILVHPCNNWNNWCTNLKKRKKEVDAKACALSRIQFSSNRWIQWCIEVRQGNK